MSGRIENFGNAQHWEQISLKPFNIYDGLAQLKVELKWLGATMPKTADAQRLINTLGGLSPAIHLAARYLAQGYSTEEFLDSLAQTGYKLQPADASDDLLNRDAAKAVLNSTFTLSLTELSKQAAPFKIDAADQLFAYLGTASMSGFDLSIAETLLDIPTPLSRSLLRLAQKLSLIDLIQAEPPRWQLHPLLATYLRDQIENLSDVEERLNQWFLQRLPEPDTETTEPNSQHGWHELNAEPSALAEWLGSLPANLQYETERAGSKYAMRNGPFIQWMLFCEAALEKAISYAEQKYQLDTRRDDNREAALAKGKIADILYHLDRVEEAFVLHESLFYRH